MLIFYNVGCNRCDCGLCRQIKQINFFFNLHSGGWNQGPLDTAAT
jgi:hypothetical protein